MRRELNLPWITAGEDKPTNSRPSPKISIRQLIVKVKSTLQNLSYAEPGEHRYTRSAREAEFAARQSRARYR